MWALFAVPNKDENVPVRTHAPLMSSMVMVAVPIPVVVTGVGASCAPSRLAVKIRVAADALETRAAARMAGRKDFMRFEV
jgi:hypothetical protein